MEKMVKFRNIIVHQYEEVDAEIVVVILQKHLADSKEFKETVLGYLRGHKALLKSTDDKKTRRKGIA